MWPWGRSVDPINPHLLPPWPRHTSLRQISAHLGLGRQSSPGMQVVYRARTRKHSSVSRGPEPLTQQPQPPEYLGAAKKITRSLAAPRPHTAILGACGGHRFPGCCPNPVHFPQARNDVLGTGDFLRRLPPWTNGSGSWSWALLRGRAPFSLVFWRVLRLQNPSPPSGPPSFSLPPSLPPSLLPPSFHHDICYKGFGMAGLSTLFLEQTA